MQIIRVRDGESIFDIAGAVGLAPQYLMGIAGCTQKFPTAERELGVFTPSRSYSVRSGDTAQSICRRFGIGKRELLSLNPEIGGSGRLYGGQYIVLGSAAPRVGVGVINGYAYRGLDRGRLTAALPYLDLLTVAAARAEGKKIRHSDSLGVVSAARAAGVYPMLRVYLDGVGRDDHGELAIAIATAALAGGYVGAVLAGLSAAPDPVGLTVEVRRRMIEAGLTLGVECELCGECRYAEYADHTVLRLDRPEESGKSFEEYEYREINECAERMDVSGGMLELPALARSRGGILSRADALAEADMRGSAIAHCDEARMMTVTRGRRRLTLESMTSVQGRIIAAAECGYLGVAVDLLRVPFAELFMARLMLSRAVNPTFSNTVLNCEGEKRMQNEE